jgi:hypothetical protein
MMRGALAAFSELGLRVGEDVKVATHSNKDSNVLLGYEPLLTRLQVDSTLVACAIFEMLETLMKGDVPPEPQRWVEPVIVRPAPAQPILQPLQTRTGVTPLRASKGACKKKLLRNRSWKTPRAIREPPTAQHWAAASRDRQGFTLIELLIAIAII